MTTMTGASAAARAIFAVRTRGAEPRSLQELHEQTAENGQRTAVSDASARESS